MPSKVSVPLKTHGGKAPFASQIVDLFPRHLHYVEPFAGGLAVLLARDPDDASLFLPPHRGVSEVVNDLNGQLVNLWRVLQSEESFPRFVRQAQAIPLSEEAWRAALDHVHGHDQLADAVAYFVLVRQSLAGRKGRFTSITKTRVRRGMNGNVSEWLSAVDGLAAVHERLRRVAILCGPALEVIQKHDTPNTLHYVDPPYPHSTRTAKRAYGPYEMTDRDHAELLDVLCACKGKVILSGYPCDLYNRRLKNWNLMTLDRPNNASGAKRKGRETECLWMNF